MALTVSEIIDAVRWCIDEEELNEAQLAYASDGSEDGTASDNKLMNNIIKSKIGHALRWVCLYAPAEQLSGGGSEDEDSIDIIKEDTKLADGNGLIQLDPAFVRLIRVKGSKWHRAIMGDSVLKEDSDEYLQLMDDNGAEATNDRPQAALINTKVKSVEVRPFADNSFTVTYVVTPSVTFDNEEDSDDKSIGIPPMVETSFIYYLAFLLLSAYADPRAERMLQIAQLNLGRSEDKQRL